MPYLHKKKKTKKHRRHKHKYTQKRKYIQKRKHFFGGNNEINSHTTNQTLGGIPITKNAVANTSNGFIGSVNAYKKYIEEQDREIHDY